MVELAVLQLQQRLAAADPAARIGEDGDTMPAHVVEHAVRCRACTTPGARK